MVCYWAWMTRYPRQTVPVGFDYIARIKKQNAGEFARRQLLDDRYLF